MQDFSAIDGFVGNHQDGRHLEARACPLCGSNDARVITAYSDFQFFSDSSEEGKRVDVRDVQCRRCLTLFRSPSFSPTGFITLFAEAGLSYGSTSARPQEQIDWLHAQNLLRPGEKFLDVGCYEGGFLSKLPQHLHRMGVDIDRPAIERGRARDPELVLTHSAFEAYEPSHAPSVITLFHVLEHLPNPLEVLRRLRRFCTQDARLVVEVPVLEQGETNDINGFFSVQHLTHFSKHSLHQMLAKAGWGIVSAVAMPGYNGYRVLAQPAVERSDVSAAVGDMLALHEVLRAWFGAQCAIESLLCQLPSDGRFVIWGAGLHTEILYQLTSLFRLPQRRFMLVDGDPMKQGKHWRGLSIRNPSALKACSSEDVFLIPSSYAGQASIEAGAQALGIPASRVRSLYNSFRLY